MIRVILPPQICRSLETDSVEIEASTVRQMLEQLVARFPVLEGKLVNGGKLRSGMAIAVDGTMIGRDHFAQLDAGSEVRFVPGIGGG